MSILQQTWRATMAAVRAFRENFASSSPILTNDDFSSFDGRRMRYAINWTMYENTAYRKIHSWSSAYKTTYGLYRYIRNIYNPALQLADFWQSHLWGGLLDVKAGNGKQVKSAIPITMETENEKLRAAIAQVWMWSNWQSEKDTVTLRGAVLGDSFIKVVDDVEKKKVYMYPVHPSTVSELDIDKFGNVKGYTIEEMRQDPKTGQTVRYKEEVSRGDGDNIVFRTFLNDALFAWDGESAEWETPYGFVPMVFIRHRHVGLKFGWAEMHAELGTFREVDDQASLLHDQIRKVVNSGWLFSGVSAPKAPLAISGQTETMNNPEAGREETPALYGPAGSTATPLVAPLNISEVSDNIKNMLAKIERSYPELSEDIQNAGGDVSGRALRINRQPIIDRVEQRRPNYDSALVRAQQMAVAIGGYRAYENFSGFDLDSYASGKLDHSIDGRPVYAKDPLDDLEVETEFWTAANAAKTAGGMTGMTFFFRKNGWSEKDVAEFINSPENEARLESLKAGINASKQINSGNG